MDTPVDNQNEDLKTYVFTVLHSTSHDLSADDVMLGILASAEEACETLLHSARDARYAAQAGDWERAATHLERAKGYGYFDDEFHVKLIREHINYKNKHE